jgi:hypothetical protein
MTYATRFLTLVVSCVAAVTIAGLSRLPVSSPEGSQPLVRLSWRILGVRAEECRPRTEEELAALAAHMRTPEVCTGGVVDYALTVSIDGVVLITDTVRPAGARRDRPVYVFRDLPVSPGTHRVEVEFAALVPPTFEIEEQRVEYEWEGDVVLQEAEIALITLDSSGDALTYRSR